MRTPKAYHAEHHEHPYWGTKPKTLGVTLLFLFLMASAALTERYAGYHQNLAYILYGCTAFVGIIVILTYIAEEFDDEN